MPKLIDRIERGLSLAGERYGIDTLTYNPLAMRRYDAYGARDAPGFTQRLITTLGPRTYLDVGAGTGRYAGELRKLGVEADACEYSPSGRRIAAKRGITVYPFDLGPDPIIAPDGTYDVAVCLEVAEHLPAVLAPKLVGFLARFPTVVFTAAPPGQGGTGHINEQPKSYWEALFAKHSYRRQANLEETFLRADGDLEGRYLLENLMIYAMQ